MFYCERWVVVNLKTVDVRKSVRYNKIDIRISSEMRIYYIKREMIN